MKKILILSLIVMLMVPASLGFAQDDGDMEMHHPHLVLSGVYYNSVDNVINLTITNPNMDHAIEIHGVTTPIADEVMLVDAMGEPLEHGLVIEAGGIMVIGPDSYQFVLGEMMMEEMPAAFQMTLLTVFADDMMMDDMDDMGEGDDMDDMHMGDMHYHRQFFAVPVLEEAPAELPLIFERGWARDNFPNSAAYVEITNVGDEDYVLISYETNAADAPEIHEVVMTDEGAMQMRPIESLAIPAGETTVLRPGGYHLMLIGVTDVITEGSAVVLTLHFENGESTTIAVPVLFDNPFATNMDMDMDMNHDMNHGDDMGDSMDDGEMSEGE